MKIIKKMGTRIVKGAGKKEQGFSEIVVSMFFVVIVVICLSFALKIRMVRLTRANLEDGLTISTLSALIFDVDELSASGTACVDINKSYKAFVKTLKTNLDLDENMNAKNPVYYRSIEIKDYIIYNVKENDITEIRYSSNGSNLNKVYVDGLGKVVAQNGETITRSSIYVEVEISIEGFAGGESTKASVSNLLGLTEN